MTRRPLTLIHTSDIHLGASAREPNLHILRAVVAATVEARADALLLAGDIFDHNRVGRGLIDDVIETFADAHVPTVILPGNHDCLVEGGVYERGDFAAAGVSVLGLDGGELAPLHELGLTAWGRAHRDYLDQVPLAGAPDFDPANWRIALAHGHLVQRPEDEHRAYQIRAEDIELSGAQYVALGHWDVYTEVAKGRAFYSGSPLYSGTVNIIRLENNQPAEVTRLPVDSPSPGREINDSPGRGGQGGEVSGK
ncbi:MAG: metallophosphoesterase [Dehalococcoidia bacterium]